MAWSTQPDRYERRRQVPAWACSFRQPPLHTRSCCSTVLGTELLFRQIVDVDLGVRLHAAVDSRLGVPGQQVLQRRRLRTWQGFGRLMVRMQDSPCTGCPAECGRLPAGRLALQMRSETDVLPHRTAAGDALGDLLSLCCPHPCTMTNPAIATTMPLLMMSILMQSPRRFGGDTKRVMVPCGVGKGQARDSVRAHGS